MDVIITISSRRISRRCTVHSLDHPKTLNLLQFPDTVLPWEKNGMVQQTQFTTEGVVTGYDGGWVFSNAVDNSGVQPATRPNHRPATGNQWNGKVTAIRNEGVVTDYTGSWVHVVAEDGPSAAQPVGRPNYRPPMGKEWNDKGTTIRNEGVLTAYTGAWVLLKENPCQFSCKMMYCHALST